MRTPAVTLVSCEKPGEREERVIHAFVRGGDRHYTVSAYRAAATVPLGASGADTALFRNVNPGTSYCSTAKVQEKSADGGDLVKTDGKYIYLARGTRFFILTTDPAEDSAIVSDTDLLEQISELYVSGHKVVLITIPVTIYPVGDAIPSSATVIPYRPVTRLYVYDVSSPDVPLLTASFDFPGYAPGSGSATNRLYPVINRTFDLLPTCALRP